MLATWQGYESGHRASGRSPSSTGRREPKLGSTGRSPERCVRRHVAPGAKGYPKVVEAEAAKLLAEVDGGRHQGGRHTLAELLDEYLRHQEARGRAPKTLLEARRRARDIKADDISGKDISRLTGRDLDEFYARLAATGGRSGRGRHTTTRHHYHSLIRAALNQAIRWRWLSPPNPAGEAEAPALAPDERVPPTRRGSPPPGAGGQRGQPRPRGVDLRGRHHRDAPRRDLRAALLRHRLEAGEARIWWRCSDLPKGQAAGRGVAGRTW